MSDTHVVVLAAGKGTRMKSLEPKVVHRALGVPLIEHVLRAADPLRPQTTVMILGHRAERVQEILGKRLGLLCPTPHLLFLAYAQRACSSAVGPPWLIFAPR